MAIFLLVTAHSNVSSWSEIRLSTKIQGRSFHITWGFVQISCRDSVTCVVYSVTDWRPQGKCL